MDEIDRLAAIAGLQRAGTHVIHFLGVPETETGDYFNQLVLNEDSERKEPLQECIDQFLLKRGLESRMDMEHEAGRISDNSLTAEQIEDVVSNAKLEGEAHHFARKCYTTTYDIPEGGPVDSIRIIRTVFNALNVFPSFDSGTNARSAAFLSDICLNVLTGDKSRQSAVAQAIGDAMPALTAYYQREFSKLPPGSQKTYKAHEEAIASLNEQYFGLLKKFIGYLTLSMKNHVPPSTEGFEKFACVKLAIEDEKTYKTVTRKYLLSLETRVNREKKGGDENYMPRIVEVIESECGPLLMVSYHAERDGNNSKITISIGNSESARRDGRLDYTKLRTGHFEKNLLLAICDHIIDKKGIPDVAARRTQEARAYINEHL